MKNEIPPAQTGIKRIIKAMGYSWQGILYAWRNEAAFRQEALLFIIATAVALVLDISSIEKALLIMVVALVIIVEIINSAIEAVVDRFGNEYHDLSKAAKDMGSAAVLLCLLLAGIVWVVILLPYVTL